MSLKFGFKTDVGLKRRNNQDSYVVIRGDSLNGELDALLVLADGMGGKAGGEVASDLVVRTLPEVVTAHLAARNGDKAPVDAGELLEDAIQQAHRKVRERQKIDSQLNGMGTTCVAAILDANVLTIANVGDSRAYLLRDGRLTQITQDHSSVWEQVLAGNMTPEEARASRFRNQITRAIGSEVSAEPDIDMVELKEGDSILLCSDGLSSEISDDDIARLFAGEADPQSACERLVEAALGAGGKDNVTVIALRFGEFQPVTLEKKERTPVSSASDPLDAWRDAGFDPEADREDGFQEPKGRAMPARPAALSPVLLGLLFVLAVLAGGESYALVRLYQDLDKARKLHPREVQVFPPRPTDSRTLTYDVPTILSVKAVRDAPLAVDDEFAVLATSADGNLIKISSRGQVTQFPDQSKISGKSSTPERVSLLIATDASGNRYQVNPGANVITKYDPDGRLAEDAAGHLVGPIGKGKLVRPTALAVDALGNLYVIDEHVVKKIRAIDPTAPTSAETGK